MSDMKFDYSKFVFYWEIDKLQRMFRNVTRKRNREKICRKSSKGILMFNMIYVCFPYKTFRAIPPFLESIDCLFIWR